MWRSYFQEHYGDLASLIGLVVSFLGFIVTIRGVKKARQAAEEAKNAAKEAVARIKAHILANDLAPCLLQIRAIDAASRKQEWGKAVASCDEVRATLSMNRGHPCLIAEERVLICAMCKDIGELLVYFQGLAQSEEKREGSGIKKNVGKPRLEQLHRMIMNLGGILGRLEHENFEV